jgi:ABC-2 type transport system permease protein
LGETTTVKPPPPSGFWLVSRREIRFFRRDQAGWFLVVAIPLIAFAILAWTFGSAVVRGLNVIIVDMDRSAVSTSVIQQIGAAPGLRISARADSLTTATKAIRSGEAIAAVYIPPNFEHDLIAGRRPQIVAFYNTQYFTPGNIASKALRDAISAASAQLSPLREVRLQPVGRGALDIEEYVLTNPATNYAAFLLRAVMPTVLHVVIAIATGYAVGTEFSRRSRRAWLRCAGGSPLVALAGKLWPLFAVFFVLMAIDALILHAGFELPYRGNILMVTVAAGLFIAAYQALATLIQLLALELGLGLSLTAIITSPAFGYAGVGLPVLAMGAFPQAWGALLPLRWYQQILFDQAARGSPVHASALPFAILAGMALGLSTLAWLCLRRSLPRREEKEALSSQDADRSGLGHAFIGEWRRVLADRPVFSLLIIAPVFYGVFYPQPYLGQVLRKIPIAVVDDDRTALSRRLIQTLDADEAVSVAVRAPALDVAQEELFARRVFGIVEIPPGTEREVLKGNPARVPAYVDSAYFLLFNRTLQGILEGAADTNLTNASLGNRLDGAAIQSALAVQSPIEMVLKPLYNPTGGYASYVVPAAFVLIIQQTLLMGAATLTGLGFSQHRTSARLFATPADLLGRTIAHLTLYVPALALFLLILPRIYGFSTLGRVSDIALFAVPFVLATSLMGQAAGAYFRHRETAVLVFVATTLPQFFLVGVSWPREMIPPLLDYIRRIFPSESATDGLVRINQMGATLGEVRADWLYLWLLAAVYFGLALIAARRRISVDAAASA